MDEDEDREAPGEWAVMHVLRELQSLNLADLRQWPHLCDRLIAEVDAEVDWRVATLSPKHGVKPIPKGQ